MDGSNRINQSLDGASIISSTGLKRRLSNALPSLRVTLLGSVLWAFAMAVSSVITSYFIYGYGIPSQVAGIAAIYFVGALLAFAPALFVAQLIMQRKSTGRIVLIAVLLALATIAMTSGVMAMVFRSYFAQWHAPFLSRPWMWQQLFTVAGAVYQYLVIGLRFYMPIGIMALIIASLWANRLTH